jgi:hypothetical protein
LIYDRHRLLRNMSIWVSPVETLIWWTSLGLSLVPELAVAGNPCKVAYNAGVTPNGIARVSNHVAATAPPAAAKD